MTAFHQKDAHRHADKHTKQLTGYGGTAVQALEPSKAPYPNAPPPATPVVVMSARAQKKFDQLDLDSNGYRRPTFLPRDLCAGMRAACVRVRVCPSAKPSSGSLIIK